MIFLALRNQSLVEVPLDRPISEEGTAQDSPMVEGKRVAVLQSWVTPGFASIPSLKSKLRTFQKCDTEMGISTIWICMYINLYTHADVSIFTHRNTSPEYCLLHWFPSNHDSCSITAPYHSTRSEGSAEHQGPLWSEGITADRPLGKNGGKTA